MEDKKAPKIKIEIIESEVPRKEYKEAPKKKRKMIPFKCPVCGEMIYFKCEIPDNVEVFPYRIEYKHHDHIVLIDLDNNHDIREIKGIRG